MEESNQNQRLILAAGLCLLVLLIWPVLFPRPKIEHAKPETPAVATGTTAPTLAAVTATRAAGAMPKVEPRSFDFAGEVELDGKKVPYQIALTNVGGGVEAFSLPSYKERDKDNRATDIPISLANPVVSKFLANQPLGGLASEGPGFASPEEQAAYGQMAGIRFLSGTTFNIPSLPVYEVVEAKDDHVRYRYLTADGVQIEREYQFKKDAFEVELAVTVRNNSNKPQSHKLELGAALQATDAMVQGAGFLSKFVPPPDHLQGLCDTDGTVKREHYQSLLTEPKQFNEAVRWAAIDRQYFLAAVISREGAQAEGECRLEARGGHARSGLATGLVTLKPGEERRHRYTAYFGVKKQALLTQVNAGLEGAVDYTFFGLNLAPLCAALLWILAQIHSATGSWGISILGLTILVKLILFPINQRSGRASRAMTLLKPEVDKLKEKFPDDRQRQSEEMMKLYKDHGVNPMGGCLPTLLQMPIWFSLYRSLWVSVDLYQESFLWINDLTTRDPYWILPVALVIAMFLQQKLMPTAMDPAQAKVMLYTMPLMFGAMMAALPAGLCFYIFVNTLLTIVQQHFINRSIGPPKGPPIAQGAPA
jgi:YidC/Oxa1 family membrane protein insertase